ncbi:MAG: hypothetical protein ABIE75_00385 [Candidatus Omnitrophota bacterium]
MRKGVILVVIIGVMLVVFGLALGALYFMANEARIAEYKIKRSKAFFSAQAGMVLVLEQLRKGVWSGNPAGKNHCLNDNIGNDCPPPLTVVDADIPYDVTIQIFSPGNPAGNPHPDSNQIDIQVNY